MVSRKLVSVGYRYGIYGLIIIQGCGGHGVSGLDDGGGKKRRANPKKSDANRGVCPPSGVRYTLGTDPRPKYSNRS